MTKAALGGTLLLLTLTVVVSRGFAFPDGKILNPAEALRFEVSVTAGDPFDRANEAKKVNGAVMRVRRGQTLWIQITGRVEEGFHTYPLTVRTSDQDVQVSRIKVGEVKGIFPLWPMTESPPVAATEQDKVILHHDKPFTWGLEILVSADAAPGPVQLPLMVKTTVCNESSCVPSTWLLEATFEVTDEAPLAPASEVLGRVGQKMPPPAVVAAADLTPLRPAKESPREAAKPAPPVDERNEPEPKPAALKQKVEHDPYVGLISVSHEEYKARMEKLAQLIVKKADAGPGADADLLGFILAGIFWGGISLITPCVFPMIPITVSFFLKQSEKEHHRPIVMASVYSLTIVVVLTLAATFLLAVFRWLSINPIMNYGLGALFVFFALSLFGMYEIELPSGLARFTSAREGKGGLVGTMFMALTFTIISFACVAPFLGGFGGTAASARPLWHNLLGGLAFSVTFAAPFFVLALFPALLRAMPKSGSWLNSVKVVMGFLELAAAFKFFRGAELLQSGGDVALFSYDLVLGVWIALAFLCALYLIGVFRLPHDTPEENIGVPRLLFSAAFVGIGLYLTPALFKAGNDGAPQRPGGAVYAWVDAFLLPESRRGEAGKEQPKTGDLQYAIEMARDLSRTTGKPKRIFVDFTGQVCTNCRINEKDVFPRPEVQEAFRQYIRVEIYTDRVPSDLYAPQVQAALARDNSRLEGDAEVNAAFEQKVFDEITLPLYAILEPRADGTVLIVDVYGEGRIINVPGFVQFLTGARAKEKEQVAQR
jgi:thiol:disulfide interchange protein DsbD